MTLTITEADRAFAAEAGAWLRARLPADLAQKVRQNIRLTRDDLTGWQEVLAARNFYAIGWSREMGGPGLTPVQRYLFEREYGAIPAPHPCQFGISMAGPVIHAFGNDAQRARFLPDIRENRTFWCQGYSEPGAGSDLASLSTSARREGDHYVVNGQKIWTTWAHWADWMFALVRTAKGARPQEGISFLLIDMKTPGITVRPIKTLDGEAEFNEVFFDEVRVPVENLVGTEGAGWGYGKFLLEYERFSMSGAARSRRILGEIREDAAAMGRLDDITFLNRLTRIEIALLALEEMELALLAASEAGGKPGPEASRLKIRGTEIAQDLSRLRLDLFGRRALVHDEAFLEGEAPGEDAQAQGAMAAWLNLRKVTIWGGSNEVQRMILSKQVLGLR
ncbi:acyl-CoA dehydrogenase family protein [Paracoccus aminophilus]|uniref:Acyl-CoA dehydrogenase n=1 Tax=Paracoccus aminophilus JCM 7686 TaxID=1367847 RepID=S5Y008_PARAH|nr:acyl-CoA dehydrogenase family protein [Paracoccus aminophilus]AGT10877.1 acyl-CoA dehydrogenase [Paracoccus aminophilus JCM 7686]